MATNTLTGILTKITNQKKLLIRLDEKQYLFVDHRAKMATKKFGKPHLPVWEWKNDKGESNYFMTVVLDKYDKANMPKFEVLLKLKVGITGCLKTYDFTPAGSTEPVQGVNFELTSIYRCKIQPEKSVEKQLEKPTTLTREESEIADKFAKEAETRLLSTDTKLTESEEEIDEDVMKQISQHLE